MLVKTSFLVFILSSRDFCLLLLLLLSVRMLEAVLVEFGIDFYLTT